MPYAGLNDWGDGVLAKVPVVCITGPSAVGKTSFTLALAQALGAIGIEALVICCDNYYRQHGQPHPRFGFDTAEAIEIDALRAELDDPSWRSLLFGLGCGASTYPAERGVLLKALFSGSSDESADVSLGFQFCLQGRGSFVDSNQLLPSPAMDLNSFVTQPWAMLPPRF